MAPRTSWSNLLPGLVALVAIILIGLGVVLFAGVGQIRGEKMHLYVLTNQARGVLRGTDVWIAGQKVGAVDAVEFAQPTTDTSSRVVIAVSVKVSAAQQIRKDSHAQVRAGANIIGPIVVYIAAGTPRSPPVRDGDTVRGRPQSDLELAGTKLNAASDELGPLLADAKTVIAHVQNPNGTVGAALRERGGSDVARLRAQVSQLRARMFGRSQPGPSTVMAASQRALARVDSIRALLNSTNSSFGRFRRDSTLGTAVAGVRDELAQLRGRLEQTDGTLGRFSTDSALTRSVADAQRDMKSLFDDIRRRPRRYISF